MHINMILVNTRITYELLSSEHSEKKQSPNMGVIEITGQVLVSSSLENAQRDLESIQF